MNARAIDMAGMRFASIVAIASVSVCSSGDRKWMFQCDCGVRFEASGYNARSGKITSCPECSAARSRAASVKHGRSETVEFSTWTDIQTRCHNPNAKCYPDYGGRGIIVCKRWRDSFSDFLSDMGERPGASYSIDRYPNNDGDYEPGNCRWATREEQANNKRNTNKPTINGVTKPISQWAAESGIDSKTIGWRKKHGVTGLSLIAESKRKGTVVFNGERNTYAGWSKKTGIKPSTIAMRIFAYGWSIERALTQGALL